MKMGERPSRRPPPSFIDHHDLSLDEELRNNSNISSSQRALLLSSSPSSSNFSVILLLVIVILLLIHNGDRAQLLSSDVMSSQLPWRPIESKYIPALDHQDLERIKLLNQSVSALRNRLYTLERKNDKSATEHNALTDRLQQHNLTLTTGKQSILQQWQQHQQKANDDSIVFVTSVETQLERLRSKVDEVVRINQQIQLNESMDSERTNVVMRRMTERVEAMEARVATVKDDLESIVVENAKNMVWRMDMMVNDAVLKVWNDEGEPRLLDAITTLYSQEHSIGKADDTSAKGSDKHDDDDKKLLNPMLSTVLTPPPLGVVDSVDFAAIRSGGTVIHEMTSPTFVPKHLQFDRLMTNTVRPWLGENLTRTLIGCLPSIDLFGVSRMLGLDVGVGTPEDALSSDMSLVDKGQYPITSSPSTLTHPLIS